MKYLFLALFSATASAQFSDLSLCHVEQGALDTHVYTDCVGIKSASTQKLKSDLSIKALYDFITRGTKDLASLEAYLSDDVLGMLHAIILSEGKPEFYTTAGNSILVKTKGGLTIFEKHDGYWLQKLISGLNEDTRPK